MLMTQDECRFVHMGSLALMFASERGKGERQSPDGQAEPAPLSGVRSGLNPGPTISSRAASCPRSEGRTRDAPALQARRTG